MIQAENTLLDSREAAEAVTLAVIARAIDPRRIENRYHWATPIEALPLFCEEDSVAPSYPANRIWF
jgi:hypothetical protein